MTLEPRENESWPPNSDDEAIRVAIRSAGDLRRVVSCALARHGFGNTDIGAGMTYETELDDHDRTVDGVEIPPGHVQVYADWGEPDGFEVCVPEIRFLEVLGGMSAEAGLVEETRAVEELRRRLAEERPPRTP